VRILVSICFNHTLVYSRGEKESSSFLTGILGLPAASTFGDFLVVELEKRVSLDFPEVSEAAISYGPRPAIEIPGFHRGAAIPLFAAHGA